MYRQIKIFGSMCLVTLCGWLYLGGCTTPAVVKPSQLVEKKEKPLTKTEEEKLGEYQAEMELGRNMAGRLLQYYGTMDNAKLVEYVNEVGNYIASVSDHPERRYMFAVLNSDTVNAFACPGGYILVTKGALMHAKNEAELAMILSHEVAHVGLQHMFNTLRNMNEKERQKEADELDRHGKDTFAESKVRERAVGFETSKAQALLAKYLSGSAGAGFSILQAAKAGMNLMLEKGLDHKLEFEADHEGVIYAIRAGYAPVALTQFLARLEAKKKAKGTLVKMLEKTHPKLSTRKEKIQALLREMNGSTIVGALGAERFAQYTR
jgi:predicted Zn-dependent protease